MRIYKIYAVVVCDSSPMSEARLKEAGYTVPPGDNTISGGGEGPYFTYAKDAVRFAHSFAVRTGLRAGVVVMSRRFLVVKPDTMELEPYNHFYGGHAPWAYHALRIAAHYIMGERLTWRRCTSCFSPDHQVGNCPDLI